MEKKKLSSLIETHPLFKTIYQMGVEKGRKEVLEEALIRLEYERKVINN